MTYGAGIWHTHGKSGKAARVVAKAFTKEQMECLRVVTRAYKATPGTIVETESAVSPVDLFLNYIKRRFHNRIEANGMAERIRQPHITTVPVHPISRPTGPRPRWTPAGQDTRKGMERTVAQRQSSGQGETPSTDHHSR
ncbi:hypothetical protein E4U23_007486 [Claviceps purpurea]|nr:hypothetical protein E4U23_007486 [Claviceps purpurea]